MNKIELPALHKDMYYFGYGIDIEKPIEMANIIIELQQENKILRENAEHNDKVVDKVNWDNMLLKKENQELKKKYENAVADYETTMFEKEQLNSLVNSCQEEIRQLKKQLEERPKEYVFVGNAQNKTRDFIDQIVKENQELKKQLEEWEHHLKCSKGMLDIQGQKGNYDYDEYMLGLNNGMECIIALFETRDPNYISGKDIEFTNNKTQQKEFINYLEDEIKFYKNKDSYMVVHIHGSYDLNDIELKLLEEILQKYKSIIGVSDEKK